jgi:beta-galactosidase
LPSCWRNYPRFQGGYIWDWQDKSLVTRTPSGEEFYAYGGDFGESIQDWVIPTFMTNNGIVLPDLALKPVAREVRQVYCPIIIDEKPQTNPWHIDTEKGQYIIRNRHLVWDTTHYQVIYTLRENGRPVLSGPFAMPVLQAGDSIELSFVPEWARQPDAEYHLEFSIQYAQATPFAPAGYEVGCYQFLLGGCLGLPAQPAPAASQPLRIEEQGDRLRIFGARFQRNL